MLSSMGVPPGGLTCTLQVRQNAPGEKWSPNDITAPIFISFLCCWDKIIVLEILW